MWIISTSFSSYTFIVVHFSHATTFLDQNPFLKKVVKLGKSLTKYCKCEKKFNMRRSVEIILYQHWCKLLYSKLRPPAKFSQTILFLLQIQNAYIMHFKQYEPYKDNFIFKLTFSLKKILQNKMLKGFANFSQIRNSASKSINLSSLC